MAASKLIVQQLRTRLGRFIPKERHPALIPPQWSFTHAPDLRADLIDPDDPAPRNEAKAYMRANFYRDAPIPKAQGLHEGTAETDHFLDKEMETFLESGMCLQVRKRDDTLVGVGFFAIWEPNEDYEIIDADALTWHNAAAVLAKEMEGKVDPRVTWRDLQFQHVYNFIQKTLRMHGDKRGFIWAGSLVFSKEIRSANVGKAMIKKNVESVEKAGNLILGTQTSHPGFHKVLGEQFRRPVVGEEARYEDEELEIEGRKVLKDMSNCESMKLVYDKPM